MAIAGAHVRVTDEDCPGREGWGECAPLPKLSCDDRPDYEDVLRAVCAETELAGRPDTERLRACPSMLSYLLILTIWSIISISTKTP